jgi:hypothetical protein
VTRRIPVPSKANATGSIHTTVRLPTAYRATRQSSPRRVEDEVPGSGRGRPANLSAGHGMRPLEHSWC